MLLATLALALGLSGTWAEGPVTAAASPTPKARPTATARPTPTPSSSPTAPVTTSAPSGTPAPASPTPRPSVAYTTYKVKPNDTLWLIARKFDTSIKAIRQLNNLTSDTIHVGQALKIPA